MDFSVLYGCEDLELRHTYRISRPTDTNFLTYFYICKLVLWTRIHIDLAVFDLDPSWECGSGPWSMEVDQNEQVTWFPAFP